MTWRRAGRLATLAWLVMAAFAPGGVAAVDPSVGAPRATVRFLEAIVFTGDITLTPAVVRVEIVIDVEGSDRSIVSEVEETAPGSGTVTHGFATPGGSIMPNTTIRARFRLTLDDGSTIVGPPTSVAYADPRFEWNTLDGEYVTVHWTEGGAAFGQRAVDIADGAVREVSDLLGVVESEPIDVFVYADRDAFYDVLGPASRENVGGQAHPTIRTLFASIAPGAIDSSWVGVVIPHELIHVVFDTAVDNPYHYPPRWLNEGVAVYLSEGYAREDRNSVEDAAAAGRLMPLHALTGQFPTTADQFFLAYSESVSAVDFLVRTYDADAMVELIGAYAEGVTDDEAFEAALGTDLAGFEAAWFASLGAVLPSPRGPVAPPVGPVPSDWAGEAPVPSDVAEPTGSGGSPTSPPEAPGSDDGPNAAVVVGGVVGGGLLLAGLVWWLALMNRSALAGPTTAVGTEAPAVDPSVAPSADRSTEPGSEPPRDGRPPEPPSDGPPPDDRVTP